MATYDPGLQPFVEMATTDLAARLDVDVDEVSLQSAELVRWPNPGLGRNDGMKHPQIVTDGSEIVLICGGEVYSYRTGGRVTTPRLMTDVVPGARKGGTPDRRSE